MKREKIFLSSQRTILEHKCYGLTTGSNSQRPCVKGFITRVMLLEGAVNFLERFRERSSLGGCRPTKGISGTPTFLAHDVSDFLHHALL
jgi:hypothetical protein